jgi:FkbM family methyltransferase
LIQDLRYARANSVLVRKVLSAYYREGRAYRIPFGPLRRMYLYYDRSINFHAMLGLWERYSFDVLSKVLPEKRRLGENIVVCDVGANIGLYSLWFHRYLSIDDKIYAFEPSPEVLDRLRANIGINDAANVVIVDRACADRDSTLEFYIGFHHHASSLHAAWASDGQRPARKHTVKATSLDSFFYGEESRQGPDLIKMDIEGGGTLALKGCDQCIQDKRPLFLIESHMPDEDRAIGELLVGHDYRAYRLDNRRWVRAMTEVYPSSDGVWGTLFLCPRETEPRLREILA